MSIFLVTLIFFEFSEACTLPKSKLTLENFIVETKIGTCHFCQNPRFRRCETAKIDTTPGLGGVKLQKVARAIFFGLVPFFRQTEDGG